MAAIILQSIMDNLPPEVAQRIHNPDSDSSHIISECVNVRNLDSTDYGCEIRLITFEKSSVFLADLFLACHFAADFDGRVYGTFDWVGGGGW